MEEEHILYQKLNTMSTLGIMGGTFDPIHMGHLLLAETALSDLELNGILFLPSGCSYMKNAENVLDAKHRLRMTELGISGNPDFYLSDMEIKRSGNTYTCETLKLLREVLPHTALYFLVGADCLFSIENWYRPEEILAGCTLVAAVRDGVPMEKMEAQCGYLAEKYHGDVRLLNFSETAISSTQIRKRIHMGKSIRYMVPDAVRLYLEEHGLYR